MLPTRSPSCLVLAAFFIHKSHQSISETSLLSICCYKFSLLSTVAQKQGREHFWFSSVFICFRYASVWCEGGEQARQLQKAFCSCVGFAQNHKTQSSGGKEAGLDLSLPMSFVARVWLFLTQTNEGKCPQRAHWRFQKHICSSQLQLLTPQCWSVEGFLHVTALWKSCFNNNKFNANFYTLSLKQDADNSEYPK